MFPSPDALLVSPFPPVGTVAAPYRSPAVPHLHRYWGHKTARPLSVIPPVDPRDHVPPDVRGVPLGVRRWGALLGSRPISLETCPGLGTPATPARPRRRGRCQMLPSARLRASASQQCSDFGAESSRPASLLSTLRTHQSPGEWQDSLLIYLLDFDQTGFAPARLD
jgi:hypothetical protein